MITGRLFYRIPYLIPEPRLAHKKTTRTNESYCYIRIFLLHTTTTDEFFFFPFFFLRSNRSVHPSCFFSSFELHPVWSDIFYSSFFFLFLLLVFGCYWSFGIGWERSALGYGNHWLAGFFFLIWLYWGLKFKHLLLTFYNWVASFDCCSFRERKCVCQHQWQKQWAYYIRTVNFMRDV
ncbi:hypothetical protein FN846DRAFT_405858 [Sphaerosporella brunnea]|uniref:Uncharacterized protein n=1 Tax=Sphaerosporella brunnea TaxID=1250544 RepID=A0A5J5F5A0_9PEZI|nr:hypothetical protein FN846DRAFT_405858 [Sphaerosporella brunnea]